MGWAELALRRGPCGAGLEARALRRGYFDQAHLVHDSREFSGTTPTDYLRSRGEHPNHVSV